MKIENFELERSQSLWENRVDYNLTESGVHPYNIKEIMNQAEIDELLSLRIGYGQTNGSIELRETISNLYPSSNKDQILVTNGSAEANFISMWSLLKPEDELVLMLPNYRQSWGLANSFGVKVKPFYLKFEDNWEPDLSELQELISDKTKMISVCNPNNPTGAILEERTMHEIVNLAKEVDAWVYSDEVYSGVRIDGGIEEPTFWGMYDKTIVCNGLAKSYALPGLRMGWLVGPEEFIEEAWGYHDYTTNSTGIISQQIASLVLKPNLRKRILERNKDILKTNLSVLTKWLDQHPEIFEYVPPRAGGMVFIKYDLDINSTELARKLREEKSVLVVAGDCFGMDNYIRLGIGSEKEYFLKGLSLVDEILKELISDS